MIDAEKVQAAFLDCLFRDGEDHTVHVVAEGIVITVGFHPGRLLTYWGAVAAWLAELPDEFQEAQGGGSTFLNACMDRHGNQWTGVHQRMEQLFQMGIGLGLAKWLLPRDAWSAFPGGMPYVVVLTPTSPPVE